MMSTIEASILAADYTRLGDQAVEAITGGVDAIQVDVMDGSFVPDITFGPGIVRALRPLVTVMLDVHLMVVNPERHIAAFVAAGADRLIIHQESTPHLHRVLTMIRTGGVQVGVCINPGTPLTLLHEVLEAVDLIQVMTVNPGWGGQPFIRGQLDKIRRLRVLLDQRGLQVPIAVDGGIDCETAPLVVRAGAEVLVAGSSVYHGPASVAENVAALRAGIRNIP